jgi:hypothetical protein
VTRKGKYIRTYIILSVVILVAAVSSFIPSRIMRFDGSFWRADGHETYRMVLFEMGGSRTMVFNIDVTEELRVPLEWRIMIKTDGYIVRRYRTWRYAWGPARTYYIFSDGHRAILSPHVATGRRRISDSDMHYAEWRMLNRVIYMHSNRRTGLSYAGGTLLALLGIAAVFYLTYVIKEKNRPQLTMREPEETDR